MTFLLGHPLFVTGAVSAAGIGIAAWILRWEARARLREYRRRGMIDLTGWPQ